MGGGRFTHFLVDPKQPLTTPNHPQETRHHTPRQPRHDTHLHSGHGVGKWAPREAGGGRSGRAFSYPMAAVEVCGVAWLAWGMVAGLLGVVCNGPGTLGSIGSKAWKRFLLGPCAESWELFSRSTLRYHIRYGFDQKRYTVRFGVARGLLGGSRRWEVSKIRRMSLITRPLNRFSRLSRVESFGFAGCSVQIDCFGLIVGIFLLK